LANRGLVPLDRSPSEIAADYIGSPPYNKPVAVVFVHGVLGNRQETWTNQQTSFPALLKDDPGFRNQCDVFVHEYFSPRFGLADCWRGPVVGSEGAPPFEDRSGGGDSTRIYQDTRTVNSAG
jgi:hypothetical protein